ncbi:hypothetical protein MRX96_005864 [Rhipicephalus microplus]
MRLFVGHPTGLTPSLHYQKYVRRMLRLFDVSASRSADIISTIEAINKLTLDTLAPAMTAPEPSIARLFSSYDVVELANVGLLRPVVYILGLGVETKQALTLSLGLRVAHELGWMAHREITDVTLEIAGLPRSAHARRCLFEIENAVAVVEATWDIYDFRTTLYCQSGHRTTWTSTHFWLPCPRTGWPRAGLEQCACKVVKPCLGQTFFVASCYALCSSDRYVDLLYGDPRRRCNEPVKELPVFAAAFRCNLPHTQS